MTPTTLACPRCGCRAALTAKIIAGADTDTRTYIEFGCANCRQQQVMHFVVDLTPEFDHGNDDCVVSS